MLSSVAERYGRRQIRPYYLMDSKAGGGEFNVLMDWPGHNSGRMRLLEIRRCSSRASIIRISLRVVFSAGER